MRERRVSTGQEPRVIRAHHAHMLEGPSWFTDYLTLRFKFVGTYVFRPFFLERPFLVFEKSGRFFYTLIFDPLSLPQSPSF